MPAEDAQQRFDRFSDRYVQSKSHAYGPDLGRLLALADPQPGWHLLDVATGGGHTARTFGPYVGRVTLCDLAGRMLAAARAHLAEHRVAAAAVQAQAGALPFPAHTFELVTCRIAPHHFPDVPAFLRACARVLVPGGVLLLQDHVLPEQTLAGRYVDAFEKLRDPSHRRAYNQREWLEMVETAGLQVEHAEQVVRRHAFHDWAGRQDNSPETVAMLEAMMAAAPPEVQSWLEPAGFGSPQAHFVNRHILVRARKPGEST